MEHEIVLYHRPDTPVIDEILEIVESLTGRWFTPNVPEDTRRDLHFHDVVCLKDASVLQSFLMFTSLDGMLHILLMGTRPEARGNGYGSLLMHAFLAHAQRLGYTTVVVMTVPEDVNPAYGATIQFYQQHDFVLTRRYTELWERGALEFRRSVKESTMLL